MLTARRATAADAAELARLGAALAQATGQWTTHLSAFHRDHADNDDHPAFVIDGPDHLIACAAATITRSVPGPDHLGVYAHIHTVYTEPAAGRRGCARTAVQALLDFLTAQGCGLITLDASDDGAPLYRSLGFTPNERAMRLIQARPDS
ncbi:GNAT family N-acetyltransferase [Streptomyces sp. TLI_171]|uniref:GNAT family N-acetyltransferase n=1 Tax=Streptomyces sp. TLI_171 TaxID=1938859 RepID=UPI000C18F928|nr:GNAT family N-acetyltransferase [Streptomyces sp. TLI_171]RKE02877.1 ribosomal protein S18 acetylase RimI-like enzyme [Streptomyces sp. TLI_171]